MAAYAMLSPLHSFTVISQAAAIGDTHIAVMEMLIAG
jgi:hypothetical protein